MEKIWMTRRFQENRGNSWLSASKSVVYAKYIYRSPVFSNTCQILLCGSVPPPRIFIPLLYEAHTHAKQTPRDTRTRISRKCLGQCFSNWRKSVREILNTEDIFLDEISLFLRQKIQCEIASESDWKIQRIEVITKCLNDFQAQFRLFRCNFVTLTF